jgi:DNA-binding FadR family transcriptional regulator
MSNRWKIKARANTMGKMTLAKQKTSKPNLTDTVSKLLHQRLSGGEFAVANLLAEHRRIVEAICEQDSEKARSAMRVHLEDSESRFRVSATNEL